VLQVNGKLRAKVEAPVDATEDELTKIALGNERIKELLAGKTPRKVVAVVNKLVNVVV
jgi:leucyl-tRNA synthetase